MALILAIQLRFRAILTGKPSKSVEYVYGANAVYTFFNKPYCIRVPKDSNVTTKISCDASQQSQPLIPNYTKERKEQLTPA